jgi:hypothetical protein
MPLLETRASGSAIGFGLGSALNLSTLLITSELSQSNFQVYSNIPWKPNVRTDFANLKFFQGATSCPYWIEDYTSGVSARVWIKVPTLNAGVTVLNIIPDSSTGNSNGVNTFEWFDDFSSGTYGSGKWTIQNSSGFSVTNSSVPSGGLNSKGLKGTNHMLKGTSTAGQLYGSSGWAGNFEVWSRSYSQSNSANGFTRDGFRGINSTTQNFNFLDHATESAYLRRNEAWTWGNDFSLATTPLGGSLRNNWMRISHRVVGNTGWQYIEDSTGKSIGPRQANDAIGITLSSSYRAPYMGERGDNGAYGQTYECYWDACWIKKAAAAEPTTLAY